VSNSSSTTKDFAITIVVDGLDNLIFPRDPWPYGQFEFSRREDPFPAAEAVFQRELGALEHPPIRPLRMRACVVGEVDAVEAVRQIRDHANETLALMQVDFLSSHSCSPVLTNVGYVLDLQTNRASGLPPSGRARPGGTLALLDEVAHNPTATLTLLLAADSRVFGELGSALRRSAHWRNVAKSSSDRVQYVLMTWMACEVLCKVSECDNVSTRILAASGFLTGRYAQILRQADRATLKTNRSKIEYWRRELFRLVESCRKLRNAIVHAGYRDIEMTAFLTAADFTTLRRFLGMALPRLQGLAVVGLQLGMRRVKEVWAHLDQVFYYNTATRLETDLLGNVIYILEHPFPFAVDD
jgi:hypothetical protein